MIPVLRNFQNRSKSTAGIRKKVQTIGIEIACGRDPASSELQAKRARLNERRSAPGARNGGFSLPAAGCRSYLRQKEDGMVRDPWIVAAGEEGPTRRDGRDRGGAMSGPENHPAWLTISPDPEHARRLQQGS